MGKREMKHIPIKWLFIGMLLITIPFGLYLFLWSTPAGQLESKYAQEAVFEVDQIQKVALPGKGLAMMSEDSSGNWLLQVYAKVPLINRYMYTESYGYTTQKEPINFLVKVWAGHANLKWENDKVTPTGWSESDGWGAGGKILYYFLWAEGLWVTYVLIQNDIVKTRKEKAANPVKYY